MFLFKKVTITNFRSIGNVTLNLENRGLVLIEGVNNTNQTYLSNGSGKSTLLSAIPWALYDITPEGAKADDVINNQAGKNTSVILDFEVDGTPYRIERYRKHKTHKNKVRLLQGDTELTESSVALTNKRILELFGIDLNTFLNSIMYGQGDVEIFAKASDKGKKEILENIANISIYQEAQNIAKEHLAEIGLQETALRSEREVLATKQGEVFYQEQTEAETYKRTADLIKHQKQELDNLIDEHTRVVEQQQFNLDSLNVQEETLKKQLSEIEEPETPQELTEKYNNFAQQIGQLESLLQAGNTEIKRLEGLIHSLGTSENCYACGTPLDVTHREVEREKLQRQIQMEQEKVAPINQALPVYHTQLAEKKQELDQIYHTINGINAQKQQLTSQLIALENNRQNVQQAGATLESRIEMSKTQLTNLESLPKPKKRTQELNALKVEIDALDAKLEGLAKDIQEYKAVVNEVFSNKGVRSHVLDLTTPFLNEKANNYLASLSGADIQINLDTQKRNQDGTLADRFDLQIINGSGGNDYKTNSAGERKRIDLAIALAIQDLVFSKSNLATNLVIYDECFDGLDSIGCENVIDILKAKQATVGSIFVITHNENLKALFEKVITVEKVNGITSLVEGEVNEN